MQSFFATKKINDHVVKAIPVGPTEDKRPILGADMIPHLYASMFLVAKKNSGKTTTILKILTACAGRDTTVIVFSGSLYNDKQWKTIKDLVEYKKAKFKAYTSLYDSNGVNRLKNWIRDANERAKDTDDPFEVEDDEDDKKAPGTDEKKNLPPPPALGWTTNASLAFQGEQAGQQVAKKKRRTKSRYRMPETIFVFDDFSEELRDPIIAEFIKRHRHYKTKLIMSSQDLKDVLPSTTANVDIWCIFGGMGADRLKETWKRTKEMVPFATFKELYAQATDKPYNFLYVDCSARPEFRVNFTDRIDVVV